MGRISCCIAVIALFSASTVFAGSACCPPQTQGTTGAQAADPHAGMDMGGGGTEKLHEGKKDGYTFSFEAMPMPAGGVTHHLMVSITDMAGKTLTGAKVGFDVTGPEPKQQQTMAMAMGGAYGANLNLAARGKYTVRTKATTKDGKNITYEFAYEVK